MKRLLIILLAFLLFTPIDANSQRKRNQKENTNTEKVSLNAFKFRNIGPGFLSGRISDIAIHPENENVWYITAGSGGDGVSYIRAGSSTSLNNKLIFETAVAGTETEQMRLDGTTSGITSVHIGDYANAVASSGFISKQHSTPWEMTISASRSSTTPRALIFNSHQTQEVARVTDDSGPYFRLSANSAGIQFNGDTDAVDTLDYYEEGTWTPDLRFDSSNTGVTYNGTYGTYTRTGNIVFCRFMFALSSKGTATGNAQIHGLPFTVADKLSGTSIEGEGGITYFDNKGNQAAIPYMLPWQGTTYSRMYAMFEGANTDSASVGEAIFENNSSVRGYFLYYAA